MLRIFPIHGGSLEDVLNNIRAHDEKAITQSSGKKPDIELIHSHIVNAIEAYREQHNGIPHNDDEIIYIGQGYVNVVVYIPPLKQLLRISKFVDEKKIGRRIEAYEAMKRVPDNGFLVPNSFNYASTVERTDDKEVRKEYMYWEIDKLEPIVHPNEELYRNCIRKALNFLQNPDINFGYIDFKYVNFMQSSKSNNDQYYIADFDIHSRWNIGGEFPTLSIEDLKQKYSGKRLTPYEYFGSFVFDGIVSAYRDKGWDQGLMLTAIYARLFLLKLRYDLTEGILKNRSFSETGATDDDCILLVTDMIIEKLCSLNSYSPDDIMNIDDNNTIDNNSSLSGGNLDKIYPGTFSDIRFYDDSPYTVILTHGYNPRGNMYCAENFKHIRAMCDAKHISNVIYYRSYKYSVKESYFPVNDSLKENIDGQLCYKDETLDFDGDFDQLSSLLANSELANTKLVIVGHSWGGFFASFLSKRFGEDRCIKSISLDGWNFYQCIPYFAKHIGGWKDIDPTQLVYEPTRILYKGEQIDLAKLLLYQEQYELGYRYKDYYRPDDHFLIGYVVNESNPEEATIQRISEPPYIHTYDIAYGKEYCHTLHKHECVSRIIFNQFIAPQ